MMTRKDFQKFATAIGASRRLDLGRGPDCDSVHSALAGAIADVLASSNPSFDRAKFWEWVREVETGVRNLDGEKVPVSERRLTSQEFGDLFPAVGSKPSAESLRRRAQIVADHDLADDAQGRTIGGDERALRYSANSGTPLMGPGR